MFLKRKFKLSAHFLPMCFKARVITKTYGFPDAAPSRLVNFTYKGLSQRLFLLYSLILKMNTNIFTTSVSITVN